MFDIFKKLKWFFKLRWKSYTLAIMALVLTAIFQALNPLILGNIIDAIAQNSLTSQSLMGQLLLILLLALAIYGLRYVWRSNIFTNSTLLESIVRRQLFDHFTHMDAQFFHEYRTGDLMAHATNDLAALRFVAGGGILTFVDSIAVGGSVLFSMIFFVDWKLTLLTILPFPLLILSAQWLGKIVNRRYRGALEAFSQINDHVQESVAGIKVVKTFGEEDDYYEDFRENVDNVVEKNKKVYQVDSAYMPVIEFITALTYFLTLIIGTYFIMNGRITIGQLIAYFSYLSMMTWPLLAIGRLVNTLERGDVSYARVIDLLDYETHIEEAEDPINKPLTGKIDFQIEDFSYPGSQESSLKDVHFSLEEGKTLGIVGRTGSGKSTIFKLLQREYDDYQGQILFGGHDIKEYSLDAKAEGMGYVPQQSFLFSSTIGENIAFGNPDLSQEGIEYYAKVADIHDDIEGFSEGYETRVGERGVSLSGGQKQRISIARALAFKPNYLLLDDSLSAVDARTEETIVQNLKQEQGHKTTIISAHRLSSVMHADEIIVLDQGRIIERGQHEDLIDQDGWYKATYDEQQLAQKVDEGGGDHV